MRSILKVFISFSLGVILTSFFLYNTIYVTLVYSQLHSSTLFYNRISNSSISEIKINLSDVLIPLEVCNASGTMNNPFFISQEYLQDEIESAFDILGVVEADRERFCSSRD